MRGRWRTGEKLMRKQNLSAEERFLEDKPVKFVNLSAEKRFLEDKPDQFVNLSVGKRFLTDKWPPQTGLSVKCALFTDKALNSEKTRLTSAIVAMPVRLRAGNPFSGPLRVQCCLGVCVASRESSVGASVTREQKAPADGCLRTDAAVSEHLRSEATQGARGIRPPVNNDAEGIGCRSLVSKLLWSERSERHKGLGEYAPQWINDAAGVGCRSSTKNDLG